MRSGCRRAAAGGAALTAGLWIAVGGATAQVPDVPGPTATSTTVPATSPPPPAEESPPSVPEPARPPTAPTTVPPGAPGSPDSTPAPAAPGTATTTTTVAKTAKAAGGPTAPPKAANLAPPELSIDLSEIDDLRRQARGKGPRPVQPDYGFDPSLPFQPGAAELGAGTDEAEELGVGAEHESRVRSLAAIGAGLLALVLMGMAVSVLTRARRQPPLGAAG